MVEHNMLRPAKPRVGLLDRAMAAFLAGAVGFVLLVVPSDLAPVPGDPLSAIRLAIAAAAAVITFLGAAALLRALNKPAHGHAKAGFEPVEESNEPPRLRRADAHPDAPSRSPILAGRELGVPLDEVAIADRRPATDLAEVENVDFEAEWERPLPGFIDGDSPAEAAQPVDWEPAEEQHPQTEEPGGEPAGTMRVAGEATAEIPFWMPHDAGASEPVAENPVAEAEPVAEPESVARLDEATLAVPFRKSRARAAPPSSAANESLDGLSAHLPGGSDTEQAPLDTMVERFESGLGQRPRPSRRGKDGDAAIDQRLRSALGDLKRMSGRR